MITRVAAEIVQVQIRLSLSVLSNHGGDFHDGAR
jgi:hypothetical protein